MTGGKRPPAFWFNLAVKAALVFLLLFSVFSGLERFEGAAMTGRALTYPLPATGPWNAAALCVGFGAVTAVVCELAEYWTFIRDTPELETAYVDTLGDLALGLSGSTIAALVTAWLISRRGRAPASPQPGRRPS